MEYNVGIPTGSTYMFSWGADPYGAKSDSGTGTVQYDVPGNGGSTLIDTSKNWATGYWNNTWMVDSAGNIFQVSSSGTNTLVSWQNPGDVRPVSGAYSVGTYIYQVYVRDYTNALVVVRPRSNEEEPAWQPTSTVSIALPTGTYRKLNADGTVDSTPLTSVSMEGGQGVVLVKASSALQPVLNVTLTAAIPSDTEYVAGSASNGASVSGNVIVWLLGTVNPGDSGSVTYQVRVK